MWKSFFFLAEAAFGALGGENQKVGHVCAVMRPWWWRVGRLQNKGQLLTGEGDGANYDFCRSTHGPHRAPATTRVLAGHGTKRTKTGGPGRRLTSKKPGSRAEAVYRTGLTIRWTISPKRPPRLRWLVQGGERRWKVDEARVEEIAGKMRRSILPLRIRKNSITVGGLRGFSVLERVLREILERKR